MKLDGGVAVGKAEYRYDMENCPGSTKVLLLDRSGIAVLGHYNHNVPEERRHYIAWCPMPTRDKEEETRRGYRRGTRKRRPAVATDEGATPLSAFDDRTRIVLLRYQVQTGQPVPAEDVKWLLDHHDWRVTGLLEANNAMLDRYRELAAAWRETQK